MTLLEMDSPRTVNIQLILSAYSIRDIPLTFTVSPSEYTSLIPDQTVVSAQTAMQVESFYYYLAGHKFACATLLHHPLVGTLFACYYINWCKLPCPLPETRRLSTIQVLLYYNIVHKNFSWYI